MTARLCICLIGIPLSSHSYGKHSNHADCAMLFIVGADIKDKLSVAHKSCCLLTERDSTITVMKLTGATHSDGTQLTLALRSAYWFGDF